MTDNIDRPRFAGQLDNATLVRYLDGGCSNVERESVERWLASNPSHRAELAALQAAWNPPAIPEADTDDRMWRWIAERMDQPHPKPVLLPAGGSSKSWWRRAALAAAVVTLAVGGALYLGLSRNPARTFAGVWPFAGSASRELVTPRGSRVTSKLPDGSSVVLGPDSRLRIPPTFGAGVRDVYLEGEGLFLVTHDSRQPFRVHTAHGVAEDLGTEFAVTAYPETDTMRTVVVSGLVSLSNGQAGAAGKQVKLGAGDLASVDAVGVIAVERHVDVARYVGWAQGKLVFDSAAVQTAAAMLSRWYDVDIQVTDTALARRRFSATFNDDPVNQVLRVLEVALQARAERSGRRVILRSR